MRVVSLFHVLLIRSRMSITCNNLNKTTNTMNWMTSAKKRISKANKRRPDHYKRLNAFKKVSKSHKADIFRTEHNLSTNENTKDKYMLQYIEDASKPYDNMRDFDKRKDPFDELDCISEEDQQVPAQSHLKGVSQRTTLAADETSGITAQEHSFFDWNFNDTNTRHELATSTSMQATSTVGIQRDNQHRPISHSGSSQSNITRKPTNALDIAASWDLFEGETPSWNYDVSSRASSKRVLNRKRERCETSISRVFNIDESRSSPVINLKENTLVAVDRSDSHLLTPNIKTQEVCGNSNQDEDLNLADFTCTW